LLDNNDNLQFPEILPFRIEKNGKGSFSKSSALIKKYKNPDNYDSSKTICSKIGSKTGGEFPVIKNVSNINDSKDYKTLVDNKLLSDRLVYQDVAGGGNYFVSDVKKYSTNVGGNQCLGRCGAGCTQSVGGGGTFTIFGYDTGISNGASSSSNVYSEDCLDHDMCSMPVEQGGGGYGAVSGVCNLLFVHAANDYVGAGGNCEHDLQVVNYYVSSKTNKATSFLTNKDNLNIVYEFGNLGSSNLPHNNQIYVDFIVDGTIIGTNTITPKLKVVSKNIITLLVC
jgi:hypothetical protein